MLETELYENFKIIMSINVFNISCGIFFQIEGLDNSGRLIWKNKKRFATINYFLLELSFNFQNYKADKF